MTATDVLTGVAPWSCECADVLEWLRALPDDSVDLLFTSPPYRKARTYGIDAGRDTEEWVAWMMEVIRAAAPKVRGLIAVNCEGQTENYQHHPTPYLLLADLHRAGFNTRRPAFFHRIGIPGSGGPDWLRADIEPVICITRPGKLPWSDNTACGHPPKWAPGGEMSNRLGNGRRVNQWGGSYPPDAQTNAKDVNGKPTKKARPSHVTVSGEPTASETPDLFDAGERQELTPARSPHGVNRDGKRVGARRGTNDHKASTETPKHTKRKVITRPREGMHAGQENTIYSEPVLANPGNVIQQTYTADEVAALLSQASEAVHCNVGGGQMGSGLAHENEAPFPLELPTFFVLSFCPPGGVVCDPFSGSGTTAHAAMNHGRRFIGCDVRQSQVELTERRLRGVTPALFSGAE